MKDIIITSTSHTCNYCYDITYLLIAYHVNLDKNYFVWCNRYLKYTILIKYNLILSIISTTYVYERNEKIRNVNNFYSLFVIDVTSISSKTKNSFTNTNIFIDKIYQNCYNKDEYLCEDCIYRWWLNMFACISMSYHSNIVNDNTVEVFEDNLQNNNELFFFLENKYTNTYD